jgi:nucleotide-binding universal stress UspA family protein
VTTDRVVPEGTAMYERVLIPLDGSELAETILPFAERVAGPADAEVVLLSVVEPLSAVGGLAGGGVVGPDALLLRQLEAKKYLAGVAARLETKGLRVRTLLGLGTPAVEIVEVARSERADLIAMTTHGRSGFRRAVFGSVAEAVLRTATVPVLMIRMTARAVAAKEAEAL